MIFCKTVQCHLFFICISKQYSNNIVSFDIAYAFK